MANFSLGHFVVKFRKHCLTAIFCHLVVSGQASQEWSALLDVVSILMLVSTGIWADFRMIKSRSSYWNDCRIIKKLRIKTRGRRSNPGGIAKVWSFSFEISFFLSKKFPGNTNHAINNKMHKVPQICFKF